MSVAIVLSGPWIGELRSWTRRAFPGEYRLIINGAVVAFLAVAVVAALVRIRDRWLARYAALAAAFALAWAYLTVWAQTNADVAAVERFHFVEYGLVTFLFYRAFGGMERPFDERPPSLAIFVLPALATCGVGIVDEWFQWFVPERVGELQDVFLNGAAIGCGLLFSGGVSPPPALAWSLPPASRARVGLTAGAVLVGLAVFVHVVHVGQVIQDDEIGTFRSRYTSHELSALARERATTWQTDPPPLVLRRLSREDQYLHEAVWHVQHRNEAWGRGDVFAAWRENRILEKYFEPALDTPSYISRSGYRWPNAQRADAAARAGATRRIYMSDADTPTLLTWSKAALWGMTLVIVAVVIGVSVARPFSL